jgi:two-component system osmolarity sensor histidine kinase EnvZ
MHVTLWPTGLMGRVVAVILCAILLEFAGSLLLQSQVDSFTLREDHARRVAELLVVGERLLDEAEPEEREAVIATLRTQHLWVGLTKSPPLSPTAPDSVLGRMRDRIVEWEPSLQERPLRLGLTNDQDGRRDLVGALQLRSGEWLQFRSRDLFGRWPQLYQAVLSASVLTLGVAIATAIMLGALGTPLRSLARAADKVGAGTSVTVVERGPRDLVQVARAFNAMQARISRLIMDRTQALAAVGHDLRTPLTRMRLRLDLMKDDEARESMAHDIEEMESMLDSVLTYLSGGDAEGERRRIDLAALVSTLVDANADLGRLVSYVGPDHLLTTARPLPLKRAIGNLIENGLKYGGVVRLKLERVGDTARIVVEDDGPGIPEAELEHVIEPFFRLDEARRRDTQGLGLGLAIVANAVQGEDGDLTLRNRPEGGLQAIISLPIRASAAA